MPTLEFVQTEEIHAGTLCATPHHSAGQSGTFLVRRRGKDLCIHPSGGGPQTAVITNCLPPRATHPAVVAVGHGDADSLVAVAHPQEIVVVSGITSKVVAVLATPAPAESLQFDMHVAAAVFDGKLWLAELCAAERAVWCPMCSASNLHSYVPRWPRVVALTRDGNRLFVSDLTRGLSAQTSPAVCVDVHAETTQRRGQDTRVLTGHPSRRTTEEPALVPTPHTAACVGTLAVVDGVVQWIATSHTTRHLRLVFADLAALTLPCASLLSTALPWPLAHKDKYPSLDHPAHHVTTHLPHPTHATHTTHVLFTATNPETGAHTQLLTTVLGGGWHKTHVIDEDTRATQIAPTDSVSCLGIVQARGKHAVLKIKIT
tara:strand:+ start:3595 stop:4713 length:1119 start_codon:yes stop_codon:yes gene_type:complete